MLGLVVNVFVTAIALHRSLCFTSAFSTHFIMEKIADEGKNVAQEKDKIRHQIVNSANENVLTPQAMEVKVIPLVTEIFTQAEDLLNMTPLKLATSISAQHIITSVKNIPTAGTSATDIFNMLQGLMNNINKTTEIIKLTSEFVNISSAYILSSLDQFIKSGCDPMIVEREIGSIRKSFLKIIVDHVQLAVKELNDKNTQRDMTGSDILVSSTRHIVSAFQEMTNEVSIVTAMQNEKCSGPPSNVSNTVEEATSKQNKIDDEIVSNIDLQTENHQTIKKAAVYNNAENVEGRISNPDVGVIQDITLEVLPSELYSQGKNVVDRDDEKATLKVPEEGPQERYPFTLLMGNNKQKDKSNNQLKPSGFDQKHSFIVSNVDQAEVKNIETIKTPDDSKLTNKLFNVVELLANRDLGYQKTPNLPCDDRVEPVCGIDINKNRFIIFLNDCKRRNHNSVYGTNYAWFNMDTCVENLLKGQNQIPEVAGNNELNPKK